MFDITVILAQLALIIVVARAAGVVAGKVGVPPVVGEIFAGVLLGPSLIGPSFSEHLFPLDTRPFLSLLSNIGLVLFMFVVGLELDVSLIKGRGRVAGAVSVCSIALPFSLGILLAGFLDDVRPAGVDFLPFALFLGAAMSITAFPVLARILTDRRMHRTETGGLALASAATDDILAWTILAIVVAIAGGATEAATATAPFTTLEGPDWLVFLTVPFALVAIFVVRPALTVLTGMYRRAGELTPTILSIVLVGLLVFAAATEYLGVHYIFGAFLFGAVIPHEQAAALRHEILVRLEQISVLLLLPVFFLVSGLKVDLRGLSAENLVELGAILVVAIVGKYVGAYLGARTAGVPHWQANALGILMNTRGLTELVILNVGLELGLLSPQLFSMMVVMALVTTVMTGPLLALAYPARRVARDIAEAERAALGEEAVDRVLMVSRPGADDAAALDCAIAMLGAARPAEIVVADLQPQGRLLEVGSGLSGELAEMAAAMERQELLVRRGGAIGIPVRVIAHPSADVGGDLVELVDVLAPQGLVVWSDDPSRDVVLRAAECPVTVVPTGATAVQGAVPVVVRFAAGADGEAAVVLGSRIAARSGAGLVVAGDARRVGGIRASLERRGVRLLDNADESLALLVGPYGPGGTEGVLAARAEVDAAPVDFDAVDLGVSAASAQA